jgi:hypothetical protein
MSDMIYIKGTQGEWLTVADDDNDDNRRTMPITFKKLELVPDSDALLILPIRPSALGALVQVRRLVLVLRDFQTQLQSLPDCQPSLEKAGAVVDVVSENYDRVYDTLRTLVVNCTWGEDPGMHVYMSYLHECLYVLPSVRESVCLYMHTCTFAHPNPHTHTHRTDPMSRDGIPNRYLQKMLRELGAIDLVMENLQLPFKKGVSTDELMGKNKAHFSKLVTIVNMQYRLLKQVVKENLVNSKALYQYLTCIRAHLGKGILCTPTIKEMFAGKRELLNRVNEDIIDHFTDLLKKDKAPQYVDFLMSICIDNSGPLPKIQNMICDRLLTQNPDLLPRVRLENSQGATLMMMNLRGSQDPASGDDLWVNLSEFNGMKVVRGRNTDYLGWIMGAALSELDAKEKIVRYFVRCSNLFGKLVAGRNQAALKALICNPDLALSYEQVHAYTFVISLFSNITRDK